MSYLAAHQAAAWVDRSSRQHLRVVGGDRLSFVQGMVTNDVMKLEVGGSQYVTMLTAKGAMVSDARVLRRDEDVLLDVEPAMAAPVKAFLEKYLVSEDAEIQSATELAVVGLLGPRHVDLLGKLPTGSLVGMLVGLHGTALDVLLHRDSLPAVREAWREIPEIDEPTFEVIRVEAGEPRWGAELLSTTIPLEAALEKAISYTKGCYIGQEVIARATHRGQMQRKLAGLLLGDLKPAPGAELRRAEKKVGWITSVAHSPQCAQTIALGYVHRDFLAKGTVLELSGGGAATVVTLPF